MAVQGGAGSGNPAGQNLANDTGLPVGTDPLTGFASRYNPSALRSTIWDSPWSILPDVFNSFRTTNSQAGPGYQALRDIGADPLTLYNIMVGGGADFTQGTSNPAGDYTNWLNNLYSSLGTVGGRGFNAGELLGRLFNPRQASASGNGVQSALYNILTAGDASTQMRTLFNMMRDVANVGMNPLAARGYTAAATRGGDQVLNRLLSQDADKGGNAMPVYQMFKQLNPGLVPG